MKKVLSTLILGLLALTSFAKDRLIVAPAPMGIELKHDFEVKARIPGGEWQDVSTYAFKVDRVANAKHNVEITSVAKFEFEGKVEIQVKSIAQDIKSYKIRPNSYGIQARQEGNTLTFSLDRPRYLSVEINGNIYQNLQIFADNVLEKPKVKKKKDLMYFGPGIHDFKGDSIHIMIRHDMKREILPGISDYTGEMPNMGIIAGYDQSRMVKNIRFENFTINGKVITDDMPEKPKWYKTADMANIYVNDHVENLTFTK